MRILLVEDEPAVAEGLSFLLTQQGHTVVVADTGPLGISRALSREPDLVLLDMMLPGCNGLEVCRAIRRFSQAPIIVVSARSAEAEKVVALAAGADDYVVKPFSFAELRARIAAVARRTVDVRRGHAVRTETGPAFTVGPLPEPRFSEVASAGLATRSAGSPAAGDC